MKFCRIFLAVLFLAAVMQAGENSDVVIMKNGDRLTCDIKGLLRGVLYLDLDYIDGTAAISWSKVAHVESKHLFLVKTQAGLVYAGSLSTAEGVPGGPLRIEVLESPGHKAAMESSEIIQITPTSKKLWQRFNGGVN